MFEDDMINYAEHRIRLDQLMKESQVLLLKKDYYGAYEVALKVIAEAKLYSNAVRHLIKNEYQ